LEREKKETQEGNKKKKKNLTSNQARLFPMLPSATAPQLSS
jgi:hypothetical protein